MKKYLNSNLFYQGDANIFLPLCIVYVVSFIFSLMTNDGYFTWKINRYLYNQLEVSFILSFQGVLLLILYIGIIYAITVGIFKRKKWSTFLAGPFSRMDIRARELIIVIFSVIIYILIFLSVVLKNYIQYYDILIYINDFYKIVIIDIIRIISISTITIGILAIMDSIFANLYYLVGAGIFSFIYLVCVLINFDSILSYYSYDQVYGLGYIYNGLSEYLSGSSIGNSISVLEIISMSIAFVIIGIILIFISKLLTNKMLVERMNEGIIFDFPKKVASFMIVTFVGVASAPYISNLIDDIYFRYSLGEYELVAIRAVIIVVVSITTYFVLRNFKKVKKDVYY
jgi:hypothetical protein